MRIGLNTLVSVARLRRHRGSFITEFMGTWGLYALIGALALAALGMAYILFWGTSETQNVSRLYSTVLPLKSTRGGYGTKSLVEVLVKTESIPKSMNVTGGKLYNSWGGEVTVEGKGQNFIITQNGVPLEQCTKMIQTLSNSGSFSDIEVNGTSVGTLPLDAVTASAKCGTVGPVNLAFTSVN